MRKYLILAAIALLAAINAVAQQHPNHADGFSAGGFTSLDIDNVNNANGKLVITIPIGQRYHTNGGISYGVTLVGTGRVWEYKEGLTGNYHYNAHVGTAGVGWTIELGHLTQANDPTNPGSHQAYMSPDGGEHQFYKTEHDGETATTQTIGTTTYTMVWYSRDGSLLRKEDTRDASGTLTGETLRFPDGPYQLFDVSSGKITDIKDLYGNDVSFSYATDPVDRSTTTTVTDVENGTTRTHYVHTTRDADGLRDLVTQVDLQMVGGARAQYDLAYNNATSGVGTVNTVVDRPCSNDNTSPTASVPLLTKITLPADANGTRQTYQITDYTTSGADCTAKWLSAYFKKIILPTQGAIRWTFQDYGITAEDGVTPTYGVATRYLVDAAGTDVSGHWTYTPSFTSPEMKVVVTGPRGYTTEHYTSMATADTGSWKWTDYYLPITKNVQDGTSGRYLSTKTVSGTNAMKTTYLQYEYDDDTIADTVDNVMSRNRRVKAGRDYYGTTYADVANDHWDGLGHYRQTATDGNFGTGDVRTTFTNFNAGRGDFIIGNHSGFTMIPSTAPWLLNTWTYTDAQEGTSAARTEACFDPAKGVLARKRVLRDGGTAANGTFTESGHDQLSTYSYDTSGNMTGENYYGADTQTLATGSLCSLGLPTSAVYQLNHTYSAGTRATTQYTGFTFKTLDQTIDASTGLPLTSKDTTGTHTVTYAYDLLGRARTATPQSGDGSITTFNYNAATSSTNLASIQTTEKSNDNSTVLAESWTYFDAWGRPIKEKKKLPNDSSGNAVWSTVVTAYDAMGSKTSVSTAVNDGSTASATSYSGFDWMGRPTTVTSPDGHATTITYTGVQQVARQISGIAQSTGEQNATTNEYYDRQGRLWKVVEPNGTITTYTYDVGNRLASVCGNYTTGCGQSRTFTYDQRGFLVSEAHPETGTVSYGNSGDTRCSGLSTCYDARGHALRKITGSVGGSFDLSFTYDAAERLTAITNNGTSVKSFTYDSGTPGSYPGKLVSAARHNYGLGTSNDRVVTENYWYAGKDGRVSRKDTSITSGPTFSGSFTYNDLGAIATTTYPAYGTAPARTIQNVYDTASGALTAVRQPGTVTVNSSNPSSGAALTATAITIAGSGFTSPASVTIGGTAATGVSVTGSTSISATTPASLAAGTSNDIVVTSNGANVTLQDGYFSDFDDVAGTNAFHQYIVPIAINGITLGCSQGLYCPSGTIGRTTMATFLSRAIAGGDSKVPTSGSGYNCTSGGSSLAADVAPTDTFCKYVNYVIANGVMPTGNDTVSCTAGNFCGTPTVLRSDMAVYVARAVAGSDAQVPTKYSDQTTGRSYDLSSGPLQFSDVPANATMNTVAYAKHVYYIWALGIVDGTTATTYSPTDSVTRDAMAKFLYNAFKLTNARVNTTDLASSILYHPNGTVVEVLHGDGTRDVTNIDPNSIARPYAIKTYGAPVNYSSGNYAYDGAGNIKTIGPDHFYYDLVSRLTEGTTSAGTKAQQLAYDAYGNITSRTNNGTNTGYTIQASTNRATAVGGTAWGYDGAGDVTSIGTTTYAYDPLGMMTTLTAPTFTSYYFYTPDDERIWTKTGSGSSWSSTWTVRGTDAKVLREMTSTATTNTGTDANYSWKKDYVYRDGLLLAAITGTDAEHFHLDHLGTPRLITYLNGTATAERHDYYPFGEEVTLGGNEEMKFTGHERDSNSGLDYMHARFDDAAVGRFLSVDRHMGSASRPLSWNRYSYATNNSITKLDPLGNVEVHFTVMTWIPSDRVTFMGRVFAGDGPGGFSVARSYRTRQDVTLETDPRVSANPIVANNPKTGRTFEFSGSTLIGEGHADAAHSMSAEAMRLPGGYTLLKMSGNIKNPLASLAPGITYEYYAIVDSKGKLIGFVGQHDGFPSHGASMQTDGSAPQTIFDDPATTMGPWGLFPFTPSTSVIDMWLNGSVSIDGISLNASPRY